MTESKPETYSVPLRDHQFDGIQEFDNRLPNWWLWTLYGTCLFSLVYWIHFHALGTGELPRQEYAAAVAEESARAEAEAAKAPITDESLTEYAAVAANVEAGKALFQTNCIACHMANGAGAPASVGPNLTDDFWLHGGAPTNIFNTITNGVPEKGMTPWKSLLSTTQRKQLTAFVLSIKGTNVPGGKEPQGEKEGG